MDKMQRFLNQFVDIQQAGWVGVLGRGYLRIIMPSGWCSANQWPKHRLVSKWGALKSISANFTLDLCIRWTNPRIRRIFGSRCDWRCRWKTCDQSKGVRFFLKKTKCLLSRSWFSTCFIFHPYLAEWSNLTNMFQRGLKPPTRLFFERFFFLNFHPQLRVKSWRCFFFARPSWFFILWSNWVLGTMISSKGEVFFFWQPWKVKSWWSLRAESEIWYKIGLVFLKRWWKQGWGITTTQSYWIGPILRKWRWALLKRIMFSADSVILHWTMTLWKESVFVWPHWVRWDQVVFQHIPKSNEIVLGFTVPPHLLRSII